MLLGLATLFMATVLFTISLFRKHLSSISDTKPSQESRSKPQSESGPKMNDNLPEEDEVESTPKAQPRTNTTPIPVLNLDSTTHTNTNGVVSKSPPSAPSLALPSENKPSQPFKPPSLTARPTPSPGLMPPPRAPSRLAPPPSPTSSSLRPSPSGPLPDRGPPGGGGGGGGLAPSANTAGKRNKVILAPGHSPLDWATLTRSATNLAGVPGLQRVTPSMLKFHHGRKGRPAWASYKGKVYNISPYLPFHPGGEGEMMRAAGKDGEKLFMEYHPWVNWDNMLGSCLVGIMVSEGQGEGLDDLD